MMDLNVRVYCPQCVCVDEQPQLCQSMRSLEEIKPNERKLYERNGRDVVATAAAVRLMMMVVVANRQDS